MVAACGLCDKHLGFVEGQYYFLVSSGNNCYDSQGRLCCVGFVGYASVG